MAAALALAISSSWALSKSVRRLGDLLENRSDDLDLRRSGDLLYLLLPEDLDRRSRIGDLLELRLLPLDLDRL